MADLQIPPFRTPLTVVNGNDGTDVRTAKQWYYYWRQLAAAIAALANGLRYGTHTDRLATTDEPNGAVWIETDRGNAIYEAQDAGDGSLRWVLVSGTMYGTLSPDQRPTDLRSFDAGFIYRTTDTNTAYAPREYIWSGAAWVEMTRLLYGTHAARPAADALTPARTLYVETDRGNVVYQQQANAWVYAAGAMRGTVSPDQRPTGLGANDTGFRFAATDQQHDYIWLGSAWAPSGAQTPWTSDIDAAGHALLNASFVGIRTSTPSASCDVNGTIRALTTTTAGPTSGTGIEIVYASSAGAGYIQAYDRTGSAYKPLNVVGSYVNLGSTVGINKAPPGYPLDVAGDINCSGAFRINGTAVGVGVSTQSANLAGTARVLGSVYQNTGTKAMRVAATCSCPTVIGLAIYTDSAASPTTVVGQTTNGSTNTANQFLSAWVLPGNYYKVTGGAGASLLQWFEWY